MNLDLDAAVRADVGRGDVFGVSIANCEVANSLGLCAI
jgi:hypothetical protein